MGVEFGRQMEEERLRVGLDVEQIAESTGVDITTILGVEAGIIDPNGAMLAGFQNALPGILMDVEDATQRYLDTMSQAADATKNQVVQGILRSWINVVTKHQRSEAPLPDELHSLRHFARNDATYSSMMPADALAAGRALLKLPAFRLYDSGTDEPRRVESTSAIAGATLGSYAEAVDYHFDQIEELIRAHPREVEGVQVIREVEDLRAKVLWLDRPDSSLDRETQDEIIQLINGVIQECPEARAPIAAFFRHPLVVIVVGAAFARYLPVVTGG